jgi:hypothetical protein
MADDYEEDYEPAFCVRDSKPVLTLSLDMLKVDAALEADDWVFLQDEIRRLVGELQSPAGSSYTSDMEVTLKLTGAFVTEVKEMEFVDKQKVNNTGFALKFAHSDISLKLPKGKTIQVHGRRQ